MRNWGARLLLAGLTTGITDGLFACVMALVNGSTVMRLWQNVAFVLLGKPSFDGGWRTAGIGLLMHFGVAFAWSAIFLLLYANWQWLQRQGIVKVALVYGPMIWLVMSLVVIPLILHRPPTINARWWIQLIGHFPFVGLPIVSCIARPALRRMDEAPA
ncbi:MAG TPA: hypothetical protein VF787_10570 [Thermoanaerobaculia bacterium]